MPSFAVVHRSLIATMPGAAAVIITAMIAPRIQRGGPFVNRKWMIRKPTMPGSATIFIDSPAENSTPVTAAMASAIPTRRRPPFCATRSAMK